MNWGKNCIWSVTLDLVQSVLRDSAAHLYILVLPGLNSIKYDKNDIFVKHFFLDNDSKNPVEAALKNRAQYKYKCTNICTIEKITVWSWFFCCYFFICFTPLI